ncbi:MAG: hypothetical protein QGI49_00265 [SAR202 cluster bacterium]|jgi:hypothetical protein|nr:hypothetical protein [SAR202 cluster bacterium]
MFKRTISVAFAAQGQIVDVNPPGISVADGITDVVSPPGIVIGLKEVFAGRPGGRIASNSDTHTGSLSVN